MSQTDRRYDGVPHSEAKRLPVEPPKSKLDPRKPKGGKKPDEYLINLWTLTPNDFYGKWSWWWLAPSKDKRKWHFIPHAGHAFGGWSIRSAVEHVQRRMKADIRKSRSLGIYWLEAQGIKKQLSPEFSNFQCFVYWMLYRGLEKGWIYVEGFKDREGKTHRRFGKK